MYKLLIVDDEAKIRYGLCNYFPWPEIGFEVAGEAEDGRQALEYLLKNNVDVVLSDIKMPIMSGIDLAIEIYKKALCVKVVFLSGYRDFEYAHTALVYGVKDYIIKPTKYNEISQVFSKIKKELDTEHTAPILEIALKEETKPHGFYETIVATVKGYVDAHYMDASLEVAAGLVHMNHFYLSKLFKKKTGQNFSDYVISVKMNKATELLKDINYKSYEVGNIVGYDNPKNFSRTFKKFFGKSPREFRENFEK